MPCADAGAGFAGNRHNMEIRRHGSSCGCRHSCPRLRRRWRQMKSPAARVSLAGTRDGNQRQQTVLLETVQLVRGFRRNEPARRRLPVLQFVDQGTRWQPARPIGGRDLEWRSGAIVPALDPGRVVFAMQSVPVPASQHRHRPGPAGCQLHRQQDEVCHRPGPDGA